MARLPDTTGALSPEAQKAPGKIVEQVRGRGASMAALVVQHVLGHESLPQPLADQVGSELEVAGVLFSFDAPLPEGQRAPF